MSPREKLLACITDEGIEFGIAVNHIESGEQTYINADNVFPTTSEFKVPVMVEVFRQARSGRFDLDDRLELREHHKTLTSGVLLHIQEGVRLTISDLLTLMTIVNDNTATTMLMELVGVDSVTETMHDLGLDSIQVVMTVHETFLYAFGIPDQRRASVEELRQVAQTTQMDYQSRTFSRDKDNNVSSASDMTRLITPIYQGEVVDRQACDEMLQILSYQQYNGRVPRYLPWYSVYHKTGTMRGLRNDSGIIYCGDDSRVAFTVFSFDGAELPLTDPRFGVEHAALDEEMTAEIGLAIDSYFGGSA